ncbi:tyramine beta-hydroxylase [Patella vulgata]|uniref:tyramine beta-hydroxylase n=1 Tax=Patella vulgata TaxID=6465 RepID=UPI00217FABFC|nr:tyramine beta-hydroxylase [Patella vulgata]XP_055957822.1 tyramine beta-hydroxylase [Patella vulgata]XP_055957823.1 tyramine beta-hydroxylase [Patella vulgata]XP_055957824.1 tyramine beta-hydroxylase [Patella vulgata]
MFLVLILATTVACVRGYAGYQEKIPNGGNVPHSCKPNYLWKGVGHLDQAGGGERNQFGKDFAQAEHKWTVELCEKDSDGDGMSNGQELGDPNCQWEQGKAPDRDTLLSHPGICDPWGSAKCNETNSWVKCDSDVLTCPAIDEEGTQRMDLRINLTSVPNKETTYICMTFDLPSDEEYHMIATKPIINESRVMHHMLLYACADTAPAMTEPKECGMGSGCGTMIGGWTLGSAGDCLHHEAGFRIGKGFAKRALIQYHWNNPEKRSDLSDSSGMAIYFTKTLRKYDAGVFRTGQIYLEIPPLMPKVVQQSTCSAKCTKRIFKKPAYLTGGSNHMHYLGAAQHVLLRRTDGTEQMLTNDQQFRYDNPVDYKYEPPIVVNPGDSLETVCTYKSMSRHNTTFYGEGTYEEMCFAFFNYYPADAIQGICDTRGNFEYCDYQEKGCKMGQLLNMTHPDTKSLFDKVMSKCSVAGYCYHGCRAVVDEVKETNGCFKDRVADFTYKTLLKYLSHKLEVYKFIYAMRSCEFATENPIVYREYNKGNDVNDGNGSNNNNVAFYLVLMCLVYRFI